MDGQDVAASVTRQDHGPVAVLVIDAPATRNALTRTTMETLAALLQEVDSEPSIAAAVIAGAGDHFASGGDLRELQASTPASFLTGGRPPAWDRIAGFTKPLVAAVRGAALGGGCELALTCDAIVAGDDARFGLPEVALGLLPGAGGGQRLARSLGRYRAAEVVLAGERLTAWQARRYGIVAAVVPREVVTEAAVAHARTVSSGAPLATRFAKQSLRLSEELPLRGAIEQERALTSVLLSTSDLQEAVDAFLQRRPARFEGR